jgi:hypothetical protein
VISFIFDRNGMRRHMKKGQIAMLAVKAEGLRLEKEGEKSSMMGDFPRGSGQHCISDNALSAPC